MTPLAVSICSPVLSQLFMYVRVWLMSFTELQITEKQCYLIPFVSLHPADGPGTQPQSHVYSWKNTNDAAALTLMHHRERGPKAAALTEWKGRMTLISETSYAVSIEYGRIHIESHCSPSLVTLPLFLCCIYYSSGLGFA